MNHHAMITEMRDLRAEIIGITGTVVAAIDGLVVAADAGTEVDVDSLAAVAAANLSIARRAAALTEQGVLDQTVAYCSRGYTAVYALGDLGLIVILGDEGLDIGRLYLNSRPALDRISSILTEGE